MINGTLIVSETECDATVDMAECGVIWCGWMNGGMTSGTVLSNYGQVTQKVYVSVLVVVLEASAYCVVEKAKRGYAKTERHVGSG